MIVNKEFSSNIKSLIRTIILMISCSILSSCSYNSKFECRPAKGLPCLSMSKVDKLIDNGNIEKIEIDQKKQRLFKIGRKGE